MSDHLNDVDEWSNCNIMNISSVKTKETLRGRLYKESPPYVLVNSNVTERVSSFMLRDIYTLITTTVTQPKSIQMHHLVCILRSYWSDRALQLY
jgi:hypothetical protein